MADTCVLEGTIRQATEVLDYTTYAEVNDRFEELNRHNQRHQHQQRHTQRSQIAAGHAAG